MRKCVHCGMPVSEFSELSKARMNFVVRRALEVPDSNEAKAPRLAERETGVTDDEVAALLRLTHQTATPIMRSLRLAGLARFTRETRPTRSGRPARVNRAIRHKER